ncbi:tetratricopeptide repeat protein, partial [Clostridium saudiense]
FVVSSLKDINTKVTISNEENAIKIQDFRTGKLDVLINVNILTEGTDIPNVQTIFLTRQTTSSILLNQMIGRGLRGINAGGTDKAYIVSFIDEWKYKINWVSPRTLPIYGEFEVLDRKTERKIYEQKLIDIKLIENFAIEVDKTINKDISNEQYHEVEALGAYIFTIFNEEQDREKDCRVIVFNHLKYAYEEFIDSLTYIFKKFDINEYCYEEKIDNLFSYVKNKYFNGYDLTIGFYEEEIRDILYYFNITGNEPEYMIIETKKVLVQKECIDKPIVIADKLKYENLSMAQIRELDVEYWRNLRDKVFEKFKDEEGYYFSATKEYRSLSRLYFQIDHIIPMSKGGKTNLDNLQLLTRWENLKKGDKMPLEFLEERVSYEFFESGNNEKARDLSLEILKSDESNIFALNILARIGLVEGKFRSALIYANKVLKIDKENYFALLTKGYSYVEKGNYDEAIKCLEEGIKHEEDFFAYNDLGKCYTEIKKKDIALGYYHKALGYMDGIEEEIIVELYFSIANIYFSKRKYDDARKYYTEVIKLQKNNDVAINNVGVCFERIGKFDEALEYYTKAKEINSSIVLYSRNIGKVKNKLKEA